MEVIYEFVVEDMFVIVVVDSVGILVYNIVFKFW